MDRTTLAAGGGSHAQGRPARRSELDVYRRALIAQSESPAARLAGAAVLVGLVAWVLWSALNDLLVP